MRAHATRLVPKYNMHEINENYQASHFIIKAIYFSLPIPITLGLLSLMSQYMKFYRLGINPGANNGFLYFILGPVLLAGLYFLAFITLYVAQKLGKSTRFGLLAGSVLLCLAAVAVFGVFTAKMHDDTAERVQDTGVFLQHYRCAVLTVC